jgi:hypothetical protein
MLYQVSTKKFQGFSGREESVFSRPSLGGFAGGGAEKTPAGDYSINTNIELTTRLVYITSQWNESARQ